MIGRWEQRDQAFRNKGPEDCKRWKQCTALQKSKGLEETTISRAFPRHCILELYLISYPPPSNPEKQTSLTYRYGRKTEKSGKTASTEGIRKLQAKLKWTQEELEAQRAAERQQQLQEAVSTQTLDELQGKSSFQRTA